LGREMIMKLRFGSRSRKFKNHWHRQLNNNLFICNTASYPNDSTSAKHQLIQMIKCLTIMHAFS